ncbi:unnamed protein product, partial [Urochloa humidicola]
CLCAFDPPVHPGVALDVAAVTLDPSAVNSDPAARAHDQASRAGATSLRLTVRDGKEVPSRMEPHVAGIEHPGRIDL